MSRERNSFQARLMQSEAAKASQIAAARNLVSAVDTSADLSPIRPVRSESRTIPNAVIAGRLTLAALAGLATAACDQLPYWMRNLTESADCRGYAGVKYEGSLPSQEVRVSSPTGGVEATMNLTPGQTERVPVVGIGRIQDDGTKVFEVKLEKIESGQVVEEQNRSSACGTLLLYTVKDLQLP